MIIIVEANMLPNLSETDKKSLLSMTGSDKVIVLSDKKSSVPIETMQLFMQMKAKTEFIQLEDLKMGFGLGYQYGVFSASFTKEKVKILSQNDYSKIVSPNMICVKTLTNAKKVASNSKKATTSVKKADPKKEEAVVTPKKKTAKVAADKTEEPKKTRKPRLKDLSADSLVASYPALAPYKGKLSAMNGMFIDAIKKSTDPNVSFKMQLQMVLADDTEEVWKTIKKDFAKLKALAEK